jgi:hypothetical protein
MPISGLTTDDPDYCLPLAAIRPDRKAQPRLGTRGQPHQLNPKTSVKDSG